MCGCDENYVQWLKVNEISVFAGKISIELNGIEIGIGINVLQSCVVIFEFVDPVFQSRWCQYSPLETGDQCEWCHLLNEIFVNICGEEADVEKTFCSVIKGLLLCRLKV